MENIHGKEIPLQCVTVKVPGQKPRGSRTVPSLNGSSTQSNLGDPIGGNFIRNNDKKSGSEKVLLTGYEMLREPSGGEENNELNGTIIDKASDTPNVKKRHRRLKSNGVKANDCEGIAKKCAYVFKNSTNITLQFSRS